MDSATVWNTSCKNGTYSTEHNSITDIVTAPTKYGFVNNLI